MSKLVFWIVTSCGLVGRHQRFGGISASTFRVKSALRMEEVCSTETLVSTYKSARHNHPEDQHRSKEPLEYDRLLTLNEYH
jgi:hypothetical protein